MLARLALLTCLAVGLGAQARQQLPTTDKSKSPWSQTPFEPIAIGAVERHKTGPGMHWRLGTAHGSVHVWKPASYKAATAGTVIYLHGYYTNVDQAVEDHKLLEQFQDSGRNALFIAPEAPSWNGEEVYWSDLDALLDEVTKLAGVTVPRGPVVVVGHSGAFRTILPWLANPRLNEVVLLDGFYRGEEEFSAWLAADAAKQKHRMLIVGNDTARRAEAWLDKSFPDAIRRTKVPRKSPPSHSPEYRVPVVYVRSQFDHMEIVTEGKVLPEMLRWTRLGGL